MNNDTISREAAIAAADRADYPELAVEDVKAVTDEVVKELKKLPSVEQQRRWIPVAERLPEKEGQYLVSCDSCFAIEIATYINDKGDSWFCCDWNHPENVVAWMPLPRVYKKGKENE